MSKKTLLILVAILAVLYAALVMTGPRGRTGEGAPAAQGGRLLPGVDLSTVRAVSIADGSATTHLAQAEGLWSVAEEGGAAADLNRMREVLRALDAVDDAQIVDEDAGRLAEYGLGADGEAATVRITLEHAAGRSVLALGKTREPRREGDLWGAELGRFVRVDEGPVLLIKDDLRMVQADSASWWDRQLLAVASDAVQKVEVAAGADAYALEKDTNGVYALAGAAEGESVAVAAADRLFGALRSLQAEAHLPAEESGGDEAFASGNRYEATTAGATYTLWIGEGADESGGGRRLKIDVAVHAEATPEQQAAASMATRKLNGRVFRIPAHAADALTLPRTAVVQKAEPPAESGPPLEAADENPPAESESSEITSLEPPVP